jgi:archaellum biogenesis ATPase FlaH
VREKHVLSSTIQSVDAYNAIADHVGPNDLSEQGWIIWQCIVEYYETDGNARSVDPEILGEYTARKVTADKHKELFRNLVTSTAAFECSPANVVDDLLATKRDVAAKRLASALLAGQDTNGLLDEYTGLLSRTELGADADEAEVRQGLAVTELVAEGFDPEGLIQVWPPSLNARFDGGVKPGHHILVFGRPEMGKTMTIIEMMAGFLSQGLTVLYVGNEDPMDDINMRVVNRLSGLSKADVLRAPEKADQLARTRGYETLIMADLAPGTPREITKLIEDHTPDVLVLDQLRNLNMFQDNRVLQLEQAAVQAREWAKRYSCVVVSVTQAGDSAEGKAVLIQGDVDYSNTGIPGACDVMLGLGATDKNAMRGEIVMSLPKNKVSGRHEYFAVLTDPTLSQLIPLD